MWPLVEAAALALCLNLSLFPATSGGSVDGVCKRSAVLGTAHAVVIGVSVRAGIVDSQLGSEVGRGAS